MLHLLLVAAVSGQEVLPVAWKVGQPGEDCYTGCSHYGGSCYNGPLSDGLLGTWPTTEADAQVAASEAGLPCAVDSGSRCDMGETPLFYPDEPLKCYYCSEAPGPESASPSHKTGLEADYCVKYAEGRARICPCSGIRTTTSSSSTTSTTTQKAWPEPTATPSPLEVGARVEADMAEAEGMMQDGGEVFPPDATVSVEYFVQALQKGPHGADDVSAQGWFEVAPNGIDFYFGVADLSRKMGGSVPPFLEDFLKSAPPEIGLDGIESLAFHIKAVAPSYPDGLGSFQLKLLTPGTNLPQICIQDSIIALRDLVEELPLDGVQDQAAAAGEGFAKGLEEFGHGTTVWPDPDLSTVRICAAGMPCLNGETSDESGQTELYKLSVADADGFFGLYFRNWNRDPGYLAKADVPDAACAETLSLEELGGSECIYDVCKTVTVSGATKKDLNGVYTPSAHSCGEAGFPVTNLRRRSQTSPVYMNKDSSMLVFRWSGEQDNLAGWGLVYQGDHVYAGSENTPLAIPSTIKPRSGNAEPVTVTCDAWGDGDEGTSEGPSVVWRAGAEAEDCHLTCGRLGGSCYSGVDMDGVLDIWPTTVVDAQTAADEAGLECTVSSGSRCDMGETPLFFPVNPDICYFCSEAPGPESESPSHKDQDYCVKKATSRARICPCTGIDPMAGAAARMLSEKKAGLNPRTVRLVARSGLNALRLAAVTASPRLKSVFIQTKAMKRSFMVHELYSFVSGIALASAVAWFMVLRTKQVDTSQGSFAPIPDLRRVQPVQTAEDEETFEREHTGRALLADGQGWSL